ncbi:TonB-dependent receptor [Parapedobacter defluvii]|uniref:TonB-dependent receptor n=1 Tax=Parapedobacter defluvii TaxID=2045106 RepID=A0ABQ1L6E1_9SPHI|nr:Plug domain-containing protein [Parapedobacter defluvii]GGC18680.1 TonB-dependent receptor [Parapedobacter defluvii]
MIGICNSSGCNRGSRDIAILASIVFLFCALIVHAQSDQVASSAAFAEKIYLQLDADVYTTDDTIWFKGVVVESASHRPSAVSGVLHVELIGPDEQVVDRKRIRLTDGIGAGGFGVKEQYTQGNYLVRAYTEWNRNFGPDFMFQTYVAVFPTNREIGRNPMTALHLAEREPGRYWLQAQLNPTLIDPEHQKQLAVQVTVDGKKDTLSLKSARNGFYPLEYPLPEGAKIATVKMETQHGIRYTKTLALQESLLDLQFFAESGQLVHGLASKVGFKAVNGLGRGTAVSGVVMDSRGNTLTSFGSNHLGMGSFTLTADSSVSYYAVLDSSSGGHGTHRYPLPNVVDKGRVLSVTKAAETVEVAVYSNHEEKDSLFVQVSCRGMLYYLIRASLKNQQITTSLPVAELPEGILLFTLMDKDMKPLAERLFFNQRPSERLYLAVSTDKAGYRKRDKVDLSIQVADEKGKPVGAKVSVMVINKDHVGNAWTVRENLLSRLLLSSELRGNVEEPGYYFRQAEEARFEDLDALMLTQGWRKYNYDKPPGDTLPFPNEPYPYISGKVGGVLSRKAQAGIGLTLMTFGERQSVIAQNTDSLGRFYFGLADEYTDSLDVLIQSSNKAGKKRNYTLSLDERKPPAITYDQERSVERIDSVVSYVVKKRQERAQREYSYRLSAGEILLDEVLVERRALSPQQQRVFDRYGESDVVISGDAIREREEKWSYGLYSVLLFNFPHDLRIDRVGGSGGYLRASIIGGETTLVVVDGIPVPGHSYEFIPNIPPSEVKSVELIRYAKNFSRLYQEVYPEASPLEVPAVGSVIAIYTHAGNGVYAARKPTGLLQTSVPVYSPTIEFYAPRYESPAAKDSARPDLRTLIHWAPELTAEADGTVKASYYHSDAVGETMVVVEALSPAGQIGYQELEYMVTD